MLTLTAALAAVATILALVGTWRLGDRKRDGFAMRIVSGFFWVAYAIKAEALGIMPMNIIFLVLDTRGYLKWRKA